MQDFDKVLTHKTEHIKQQQQQKKHVLSAQGGKLVPSNFYQWGTVNGGWEQGWQRGYHCGYYLG